VRIDFFFFGHPLFVNEHRNAQGDRFSHALAVGRGKHFELHRGARSAAGEDEPRAVAR